MDMVRFFQGCGCGCRYSIRVVTVPPWGIHPTSRVVLRIDSKSVHIEAAMVQINTYQYDADDQSKIPATIFIQRSPFIGVESAWQSACASSINFVT
jgi:hypothetical protein